jgi:23S rRNA pseudouridine955/2504/2580 synthase
MSGVQILKVEANDGDARLDRWLRRKFPQLTQGRIQKLLRTGQIRVDGKRAKADLRVAAGQEIRLPPIPDEVIKTKDRQLTDKDIKTTQSWVLYRDDDVIVINKPEGLATQGGTKTTRHVDGFLDALKFDGERPKLVHRLDKDTSGVLVLARHAKAAKILSDAFRHHTARKYYWAITQGVPHPLQGKITAALTKQMVGKGERVIVVDEEEGDYAETLYQVVDHAAKKAAWLAVWPRTGRTHQIRVHLALLNTPIMGDSKYAAHDQRVIPEGIPHKLQLHAHRIIIPYGKRKIDVTAPVPEHMVSAMKVYGFSGDDDGDVFAEVEV